MSKGKAKLADGTWCIVMDRGEYYTKVVTPMRDILYVENTDIVEVRK